MRGDRWTYTYFEDGRGQREKAKQEQRRSKSGGGTDGKGESIFLLIVVPPLDPLVPFDDE